MKFLPQKGPKPGDTQISASFLNNLNDRIKRLESLHAKAPINLQDTGLGLCLSLTADIQGFRVAVAQEDHIGDTNSATCRIAKWNPNSEIFEADDKQEVEVFDPFNVGFWADQKIFITKYYDAGVWIHMPLQTRILYGITEDALTACGTVEVDRIINGTLSGNTYTATNLHDWDAPAGAKLVQARWEKEFDTFVIFAVDCEASCLGL